MASDLLDNETVQNAANVVAALAALHVAAVGLMDTNVLVDTAGLAGQQLNAAYGAVGAAGALRAHEIAGEYLD